MYIASAPDYTPITFRSSLPDEILNKMKPAGFYLNTLYTDVSCNGKTGRDSNATLNSTMIPIAAKQMHGITTNASILSNVAFDINHSAGTAMHTTAILKDINIDVSHIAGTAMPNTKLLKDINIDVSHIAGTAMHNTKLQKDINIVVSHHTGHLALYSTTVQSGSSES